jgi:two-component system OmpR family response regulator
MMGVIPVVDLPAPRADADPTALRPGQGAAPGGGTAGTMIAGAILVVEDEPAIAEVVAETLRAEGYRVAVASTGAEALALALSGRPACVLLDLHLPVMDGPDFLRAYRTVLASAPRPTDAEAADTPAPVIISTAMSGAEAALEAERLGASGFLTKPFDLDSLIAIVRGATGRA